MIALLFGLLAGVMQTADLPRRPEVMSITVPSGRCRIALNGHLIVLTDLRKEATRWKETQPEIHFQPSPEAEYRCVVAVLEVLRDTSVAKIGFVMNEQAVQNEP